MSTPEEIREIDTLVHRFFRALDARDFASGWMRPYVTGDARMETPLGVSAGAEAVRAAETALGRFVRTQHIASGLLAEIDGDRATASWNALMTHVHADESVFTVGGFYEGDQVRTGGGWRFERVAVRAVWTRGRPPVGVGGGGGD
ncbi:nuclear transport factor 2 family protein [Streptomyces sp. NPDC006458]|uniref:nuclear transport factor 2 family protein n=1 Tax=Streptomyces sp. NPDC006458 TaxID=3154302 RepID=UPI0033A9D0D8